MAKQMTITIESSSLLILRVRSLCRAWCPKCAAEAEMIAAENAEMMSGLDQRALKEWLNSGELHRTNAANGSLLICLNSLLACLQNTKPATRGLPRLPDAEKEKK
jgi:hypothetical protein